MAWKNNWIVVVVHNCMPKFISCLLNKRLWNFQVKSYDSSLNRPLAKIKQNLPISISIQIVKVFRKSYKSVLWKLVNHMETWASFTFRLHSITQRAYIKCIQYKGTSHFGWYACTNDDDDNETLLVNFVFLSFEPRL